MILTSILLIVLSVRVDAWQITKLPSIQTLSLQHSKMPNRVPGRSRFSPVHFGFLGVTNSETVKTLPRDVKEAVQRCRQAVQAALQNRVSRMDVEFPVGTNFGVEIRRKDAKKSALARELSNDTSSSAPTRDTLIQSDRELARLFVEMFQPVGNEHICVIFRDLEQANFAREQWKTDDMAATCHIRSFDRRRSKSTSRISSKGKKVKKAIGFAAKLAAEIDTDNDTENVSGPFQLPNNTEVALVVAPGPRELLVVERLSREIGMGTLIVLLNARLETINNFGSVATETWFRSEFEPVFHLAAVTPQSIAPGCLIHRTYPGGWLVARKPKVGPPKTIYTTSNNVNPSARPTPLECKDAYDSLELSDLERNVESALESVSNWFR
jgi:hypothetical protein